MFITLDWNDFKNDIIISGHTIFYTKEYYIVGNSEEYRYKVFYIDISTIWVTFLQTVEDKLEFENNYLSTSIEKNYLFNTQE